MVHAGTIENLSMITGYISVGREEYAKWRYGVTPICHRLAFNIKLYQKFLSIYIADLTDLAEGSARLCTRDLV